MSHLDRITVNPDQCGGRPCIRGLRVRVKDILELLAAGVPESEILSDFPYLEPPDIRAALEYAALQSDHPPKGPKQRSMRPRAAQQPRGQEGLASIAGGWEGSDELVKRVRAIRRSKPRPAPRGG